MKTKQDRATAFILVWLIYGFMVAFGSSVGWHPEERSDGWYMIGEECETDDTGSNCYDFVIDGPFSESEIMEIYESEKADGESFKKKWGTIYNIVPSTEGAGFWGGMGSILLSFGIMLLPPYLVYKSVWK